MTAKDLIERFAQKQEGGSFACPRCGRMAMDEKPTRNALSRRATVYICDACGMEEALEDLIGDQRPLDSWSIVQHPAHWGMEEVSPQKLILQHIGRDAWDRPVYQSGDRIYVDINPMSRIPPQICTKTGNEFDGEPMDPISPDVELEFVPQRDCWG